MDRFFPRALFLAPVALVASCTCNPAFAAAMMPAARRLDLVAALVLPGLALLFAIFAWRVRNGALQAVATMTFLALVIFGVGPAFPAEVATVGDKAVILPWGDWLQAILQQLEMALVTVLTTLIIGAVLKVAPWAASILTKARVESMVKDVADYGINAVGGAVKGQALSFNVGSAVIAAAVQRALDAAPAAVIKAAGGPTGIAQRVFRVLHLDPAANETNTLHPALDVIPITAKTT